MKVDLVGQTPITKSFKGDKITKLNDPFLLDISLALTRKRIYQLSIPDGFMPAIMQACLARRTSL